ncbi:pullulanase [Alkalihalophilus marmarensis]|uniref:pullulanase n=1 Tax=Alkalihalophilus marmarensis TaxID=521377 RepID=UPI002DBB54C3|nr:pullulanase [Alkalihalophilus marmarensis]MEC2071842.1 pullulanase [Alkalihalophilus marmarensis]
MNTPPIGFYLHSGVVAGETTIHVKGIGIDQLSDNDLKENIHIKSHTGEDIPIDEVRKIEDDLIELSGVFSIEHIPFTVTYKEQAIQLRLHWTLMDTYFKHEGQLGAALHENGNATLKLWSPLADSVSVIVYDKEDQFNIIADEIIMTKEDQGVWKVTLTHENTGVSNLEGYYYHYVIEVNGQKKLGLDPYAKSMAAWDFRGGYLVGKAAIINPSTIGPELDFAAIEQYEKREDAVIYEVHVRDFTSDPMIENDLESPFGTYTAFIDKLDYIKTLGVTHIQLLPIMSCYKVNENDNKTRELDFSSEGNNYNWGYDPHGYFSPSGMYSDQPEIARRRIEELKLLIEAVHLKGMGVILDVVYNHTALVEILETLVPHYYHFMDIDGTVRTSFGGGRLGTTHFMARKLLLDSITYWVEEFKIDGFRFDMMGDHDSETIQLAYNQAKALNPKILMIGEGWRTFVGDEGMPVRAADQDWMQYTDSVGVFSDEFRNELKSGYGSEGQPRFLTNGARNIRQIFDNIKAQPHNFIATSPGDVVPYIEAHDNLTLHDVIAQSIMKDPEYHQEEIHKRIRIGNALVLLSQGTAFIHAGQEYGRTKQFLANTGHAPYKSTFMVNEQGEPFRYPHFIHDSYNSSDRINMFDWSKATDANQFPVHTATRRFTAGLIHLRRSTNAFRLGTKELIDQHIHLIEAPEIQEFDLILAYRNTAADGTGSYYVFVNASLHERMLTLSEDITQGIVIADAANAGTEKIENPTGFTLTDKSITIDPLTVVVIKKEES